LYFIDIGLQLKRENAMKLKTKSIIFCLVLFLTSFSATSVCLAENIRKPAYAGSFYPADKSEIEQTIEILTSKAKETRFIIPAGKSLKALILPHAGYIYSGLTASHASLVLTGNNYSKVILLGPDHRIGFAGCAISEPGVYETPLGQVRLHKDAAKLGLQKELFHSMPVSDSNEHSLEVVLPFLQSYLKKFELVPIVTGSVDYKRIAEGIDPILDDKTLLVASSDLSHYLPYNEAAGRDKETISMILDLEKEKLIKRDNSACGKIPVLTIMDLAGKYGWKPLLIHYSNSGDTAGDRSRVVGYAAIAFYGEPPMENENLSNRLNEKQGQILLKLARNTISEKLGIKPEQERISPLSESEDKELRRKSGTFVTLKMHNQLRGCIGNLGCSEPIIEGIKRNAINAAFNDFRFSPLTAKEFDKVEIEISILSEPRPLAYKNGEDLINKLHPGVDGVIICKGHASATFLPQVWDQLKRPEDFLSHLCKKAGLPSDSWKNSKLEVLIYNVQYFEEEK
jgi:AmmeMemoRadiSam system protein B/AmmeMemoRadiSam system protein A